MGPWAGQQPGSFPRRHQGGLNHIIIVHPPRRAPSLGLLGCFIYLKTFFLLYMYQDSTVHCAMPSSPTPHLVVAEKNPLQFSLFPVRESRECGMRVTKGECALESSEPSPELRSRLIRMLQCGWMAAQGAACPECTCGVGPSPAEGWGGVGGPSGLRRLAPHTLAVGFAGQALVKRALQPALRVQY